MLLNSRSTLTPFRTNKCDRVCKKLFRCTPYTTHIYTTCIFEFLTSKTKTCFNWYSIVLSMYIYDFLYPYHSIGRNGILVNGCDNGSFRPLKNMALNKFSNKLYHIMYKLAKNNAIVNVIIQTVQWISDIMNRIAPFKEGSNEITGLPNVLIED